MQIYTSNAYSKFDLDNIRELNLGILIAGNSNFKPSKKWHEFPLAMDNGAYQNYLKGLEFDEYNFYSCLDNCLDYELNFVVLPDIVAGGIHSLAYSLSFIDRLSDFKLAFAVQDGILTEDVQPYVDKLHYIFLGGTTYFKAKESANWSQFAHDNNLKFHYARTGTLQYLQNAENVNSDSCDSASFVRNKTYNIIRSHYEQRQQQLFR